MVSPLQFTSISEVLGAEFSRRKLRNGSYSLRAFARDLELSPSRLSEVMKGNEGLSETSIDKMSLRLTRKPLERRYLKDLVLAQSARNRKVRELAEKRLSETRKAENTRLLKEDQFRVISEWYHTALVELVQLKNFVHDVAWMASKLGISVRTTEIALTRLQNLGILAQKNGRWTAYPEAFSVLSDVPSHAMQKFHRQILELHSQSLFEDELIERDFTSVIFAAPKSRIPELHQKMREFAIQLWQEISEEEKDQLYSFSIQLCPIKNRRPGENENAE